ncbi:MAG: hypothetical protein JWN37_739 [Candidatus Nomurabacteria bacterium]|nr:hypothetical protein [Candidatus Nomurabacteria bacterium]
MSARIMFFSFLIAGVPAWGFAYQGNDIALVAIAIFTTSCATLYLLARHLEKESAFGPLFPRAAFGAIILPMTMAMFIAAVIAWKHWPQEAISGSVINLFLSMEGHRLINGWRLFIPVKGE